MFLKMLRFLVIILLYFYQNLVANEYKIPMIGQFKSRTLFDNPYANIPAQCYIETSYGTQNACLFCHTNAPAKAKLGTTLAQTGADESIGNLQLSYAFGGVDGFTKSPNINPWENLIYPKRLEEALRKKQIKEVRFDIEKYLKEDNWQEAYDKKRGNKNRSNSHIKDDEFRLFPALNPSNLPANKDGFVRTPNLQEAIFKDSIGFNTGWRAINFFPYGIFTPHSGSVSGVYIRLDSRFMRDEDGRYNLEIYKQNLTLLEKAIQDRLSVEDKNYIGLAKDEKIYRGLFPLGTEFAHPLHYVDVDFAGLRASRVKEVRCMYKYKLYHPSEVFTKDENAPLYYNEKESWMDNGAGWYMSGFIEDEKGSLRGQTPQELMQCVGCHSSTYGFEPEQFTSGTSNTIDTIWSFSRKGAGDKGWGEMDYFGYKRDKNALNTQTCGVANMGDPINRDAKMGEFRYFLNHVVGASLYGDMPLSMERYLAGVIQKSNGYSGDFPPLKFKSESELKKIQKNRLKLIREFTAKKDYLNVKGYIQAPLLYPTKDEALRMAKNYRKVVLTQRFNQGKDYSGEVKFSFRYFREKKEGYKHIDEKTSYKFGEVITDRPYHKEESILKYVGKVSTLIDEQGDNYDTLYMPILKYPQAFESK
ncbi:MAG: hypothetical protein FNT15_09045 [Sulfurovum sp.]|nr:MAG: hypothetical protein FNT15_09045 [Sulfurovum sp.]